MKNVSWTWSAAFFALHPVICVPDSTVNLVWTSMFPSSDLWKRQTVTFPSSDITLPPGQTHRNSLRPKHVNAGEVTWYPFLSDRSSNLSKWTSTVSKFVPREIVIWLLMLFSAAAWFCVVLMIAVFVFCALELWKVHRTRRWSDGKRKETEAVDVC